MSLGSSATISWRRKSAHTHANASFNKGMPDPRKEPCSPIALSLTTSHGVSDIQDGPGRADHLGYRHDGRPRDAEEVCSSRHPEWLPGGRYCKSDREVGTDRYRVYAYLEITMFLHHATTHLVKVSQPTMTSGCISYGSALSLPSTAIGV
jgi:hypothetical protein